MTGTVILSAAATVTAAAAAAIVVCAGGGRRRARVVGGIVGRIVAAAVDRTAAAVVIARLGFVRGPAAVLGLAGRARALTALVVLGLGVPGRAIAAAVVPRLNFAGGPVPAVVVADLGAGCARCGSRRRARRRQVGAVVVDGRGLRRHLDRDTLSERRVSGQAERGRNGRQYCRRGGDHDALHVGSSRSSCCVPPVLPCRR